MISMFMRVHHDQRNRLPSIFLQPTMDRGFNHRQQIAVARSRIEQQGSIAPKQQVDKWFLKIGTA
jgi:hypothetical protein